jgi:hypothetical protein
VSEAVEEEDQVGVPVRVPVPVPLAPDDREAV